MERHDLTLQIINQRLVYLLKGLIIVTIPAGEQFSYENLGIPRLRLPCPVLEPSGGLDKLGGFQLLFPILRYT